MTYLEVLGCLGTALVELLGSEVDFKVGLVVKFLLVLVNVKGFFFFGGGGGGRGAY